MALKKEEEAVYLNATDQCLLFTVVSLVLRKWSISPKMVLFFTNCAALISTAVD